MERLLSRSEPSHRSAAAVSYPRKEAATGTFRYLEDSTLKKKQKTTKKSLAAPLCPPLLCLWGRSHPSSTVIQGKGAPRRCRKVPGAHNLPVPSSSLFFPHPFISVPCLCNSSAGFFLHFSFDFCSSLHFYSFGDSGGGVLLFLHLPTHGARPLAAGSIWHSNNQALGGQSPITLGHQN